MSAYDPRHNLDLVGKLVAALRTGDPARVQLALAAGPDLNQTYNNLPLLPLAMQMEEIEQSHLPRILELLLDAGAPLSSAPDPHVFGLGRYAMLRDRRYVQREDPISTLLYCRDDDSESLTVLLEHGADPCVQHLPQDQEESPYGPLDSAVVLGARRSAALLLTYGAAPDGGSGHVLDEIYFGRNPRDARHAREMVGILLSLGADPTRPTSTASKSLLVHPMINQCYGSVLDLILAGADPDVRVGQQVGFRTARTPRQMLKYLVRHGDQPGFDGVRPSQAVAAIGVHAVQSRLEQNTAPATGMKRSGVRI